MSLNVGVKTKSDLLENIPNFGVDGFCALLPYQRKKSFLDDILGIYDNATWLTFLVSVFCGALLWQFIYGRLRRRVNSTSDFLFNIFGMFLLQSPEMARLHRLQVFLLQFFVLGTFIMGTAFQSQIISLMFDARNETTVNNVDALMKSDFHIFADEHLFDHLDKEHFDQGKIHAIDNLVPETIIEIFKNKSALIMRCDQMYIVKYFLQYHHIGNDHYLMNGKVVETLDFYTFNKKYLFKDRIKDYILRYFEAGLRQYWKESLEHFVIINYSEKVKKFESDEFLNLTDVAGAFWILLGGLTLSFLAFIVELIWHRFKFIQFQFVKMKLIRINWKKSCLDFEVTQGTQKSPAKIGMPLKVKQPVKVFNKKDWKIKSRKCQLGYGELHIKFVIQSKKISDEKTSFFDMKFKRSGIVAFMKKPKNTELSEVTVNPSSHKFTTILSHK
jgi:hypothetical protein